MTGPEDLLEKGEDIVHLLASRVRMFVIGAPITMLPQLALETLSDVAAQEFGLLRDGDFPLQALRCIRRDRHQCPNSTDEVVLSIKVLGPRESAHSDMLQEARRSYIA
jgi:hypothetical protein